VQVDLAKNQKGEWMGTIAIPAQHTDGFPLSEITEKENRVQFAMQGIPGDPRFDGKVAADGQSIAGDFTQGGNSLTFSLKRNGEAKIKTPVKSTAISKDLEGAWEGVLDVNGTRLRLKLKIANQPDGTAAGSMVSLDQGGAEIPITTITQKGSSVKLELKTINGIFKGELKNGALGGDWSQGPGTLPLTFQRPAK